LRTRRQRQRQNHRSLTMGATPAAQRACCTKKGFGCIHYPDRPKRHACNDHNFVISSMLLWTLRVYLDDSRRDVVKEWYDTQSGPVQAAFNTRLEYLLQRPSHEWKMPHFRLLHGECAGLGEVRFKADKVQHRPIGFFGPLRSEFTLLLCAIEKGSKFKPRNACPIGQVRKHQTLADRKRSDECNWL
jgi:hypothetical protein